MIVTVDAPNLVYDATVRVGRTMRNANLERGLARVGPFQFSQLMHQEFVPPLCPKVFRIRSARDWARKRNSNPKRNAIPGHRTQIMLCGAASVKSNRVKNAYQTEGTESETTCVLSCTELLSRNVTHSVLCDNLPF
jgi:hypothetical protein